MSRVYNALTGAARPAGAATLDTPDDGAWENTDDAPFVEIGGPGGPVFSAAPGAAPRPLAEVKPEPKAELKIEPARTFPRLAPATAAPAYLSVRFHDAVARGAAGTAGDGPDASLVALHLPDHPVSGEYRTVRDEIRKQLPDATSRVLHFTAAAQEAGTTTVLLNLAVTLAREGKARVLVVDANVARPGVAAKLALKPAPGLCEVLAQRVPLPWAPQQSAVPNLQALAAGDATDATAAAVGRDLAKLLGQLRQWYDWVLVDGGVWGGMPERDAACPSADAVYLVTRDTNTERPEFASLRGWVKELGGLLRGYVATRV
jgi:Mrp family chromosome partitioning ATPase